MATEKTTPTGVIIRRKNISCRGDQSLDHSAGDFRWLKPRLELYPNFFGIESNPSLITFHPPCVVSRCEGLGCTVSGFGVTVKVLSLGAVCALFEEVADRDSACAFALVDVEGDMGGFGDGYGFAVNLVDFDLMTSREDSGTDPDDGFFPSDLVSPIDDGSLLGARTLLIGFLAGGQATLA